MTNPSFDELASAHLDGATTSDEAAQVDADPTLQARVEELRAVRAALAAVPSVDPARREAAIAAALAAFADGPTSAGTAAPITDLATVAGRRGPSPRALRLLGAAAAVALLAVLVPVIGRLAQSHDEDQAGSSFEATRDAAEGEPVGPEDRGADTAAGTSSATSTTAGTPGEELGRFDDIAALVAALSGPEPQASVAPENDLGSSPDEGRDCASATTGGAKGQATDATRVEVATATVAGDDVLVVVRTETSGARTLLVYRVADCALVDERPL